MVTRSVSRSVVGAAARSVIGSGGGGASAEVVSVPSGFTWTPPFTVSKTGSTYSTDYDPADKLPSGWDSYTTYYVDHAASGGAGTEGDPYDSLYTALHNRSSNILVYAKPGVYSGNQAWRGAIAGTFGATAYNVVVRRWPGETGQIVSDMSQSVTWTLESGNVWKATTSGLSSVVVVDMATLDSNGLGKLYESQNSIVNCEANPGSHYYSSNTVYVHTTDSREPDADIVVYKSNTENGRYAGGGTCWTEYMSFLGGSYAFHASGASPRPMNHNWYTTECKFLYSGIAAGGSQITGGIECIHHNAESSEHGVDGFKFLKGTNASAANYALINPVGHSNGEVTVTNVGNGSSAHDGGRGVIVNGLFTGNRGRQIHNITDSETWCLGTSAGPSAAATSSNSRAAFACGTGSGDVSKMWLDGCASLSPDTDLDVAADSTIYLRNFTRLAGSGNDEGTGTITTY